MDIFQEVAQLKQKNLPFVLATVVKISGSVPGRVGFKMLVREDGSTLGTVGGGELERRVTQEALERLQIGESGLKEYLLREDAEGPQKVGQAEVVPMMCHGKMWIFYEVSQTRPTVYLFGGGHVGQALSAFLRQLNYTIVLIDNREEFASEERNPHATERVFRDYVEYAREFQPQPNSFAVIMTQGHNYDYQVLKTIYQRKLPLRYIGIIASRAKANGLIRNLKEDFGEEIDLSGIFTPVGLDIGGDTESEIALSIASEIQAIRFERNVPHLRIPPDQTS